MLIKENNTLIHFYSIISIVSTFLIMKTIKIDLIEDVQQQSKFFDLFIKLSEKFWLSITIVLINLIAGLISIFMLANKINFNSLSEKSSTDVKQLFLISHVTSILIVQFGGWILQTVLTYFILILLDMEMSFKKLSTIIGIGYIGFLICSITLYIYNSISLNNHIPIEYFNLVSSSNNIAPVFAKICEYFTLTLISIFLYINLYDKKITKFKSIIASSFPGLFLLAVEQFFKYI